MSDALTDIARDGKRAQLLSAIAGKERDFLAAPSREKASELIKMWRGYCHLPRGYWGAPNRAKAQERVALYREYLETGEFDPSPVLADLRSEGVVRIGNGFVVNDEEIDGLVWEAIYRAGDSKPVNHSVFRLKVSVKAERVTCAACPFFGCGYCTHCNSRVGEEFAVRRERAAKGAGLL